jgi:hypothetical protein
MGSKLPKDTFPAGHSPDDFQCFGPPATKDGEFQNAKIADFGCFKQGDVDSNKWYYAAVTKSRKTQKWYAYFEWGRVGASKPSFQFVECSDEADAQEEFVDQCRSKNDKRGQWGTVGGMKVLQPKPGKDCYLVRPMAKRNVGLPDGKTITLNEGAKPKPVSAPDPSKKSNGPPARKIDAQTVDLMRALNVATVTYARSSIVGGAIPSQVAIDEARNLLNEALKRVAKVGDSVDKQVADRELLAITSIVYSRIPKVKPVGAAESTWILSSNNIGLWQQDLDAFEAALNTVDPNDAAPQADPFNGMRLDMEWIDPKSELGKYIYGWWPDGSGNRHAHVGRMRIKNIWRVERHEDRGKVTSWQDRVLADKVKIRDRPLYQPPERTDCGADNVKRFKDTNTALLFHGTRSVNVSGILRESWRLPKQLVGVVITGAMFGPGIYWADDWRKSDGYTSRPGSYYAGSGGHVQGRGAFMFAADVVCGNPFIAPHSGGYTKPPAGPGGEKTHCVFGKMGHSGVANNEWIVFERDQMAMRYLCEYETSR